MAINTSHKSPVGTLRQAHRAAFVVPMVGKVERVFLTLRAAILPTRRIAVGPSFPNSKQVLLKIAALNGYELSRLNGEANDMYVHFTGDEPKLMACGLPYDVPVINRHSVDISKRYIAEVFKNVFKYSLAVDPTTFVGQIVEKSDANATHDGRVLDGPIQPSDVREGYVYQRLVKNTEEKAGDEVAIDLRTPLYNGSVPLVYLKRRPVNERFQNKNLSVEILSKEQAFSTDELHRLAEFARAIGLDYGELDVLRDRESQLLYVVDVANTPAGPPNGLPASEARRAVEILSKEFDKLCEDVIRRNHSVPS